MIMRIGIGSAHEVVKTFSVVLQCLDCVLYRLFDASAMYHVTATTGAA